MLIIHGRLAPEDGALLLKAVTAMKDRLYREEREAREERGEQEASGPPQPDPVEAGPLEGLVDDRASGVSGGTGPRSVDALLRLVETGMQAEPKPLTGGERTQVVLHVPVHDPVQADHPSEHPVLDVGPVVAAETCNGGWDGQPWDCGETVEHVWAATTGSIELPSCSPKEDWTWSRERGWRHVSAETPAQAAPDSH